MAINIGILEGLLTLRDDFTGVIDNASKRLEESSKKLTKTGQAMSSVGSTLSTRITAPLTAMAGAATFAATSFESAFAGVIKTVDGAGDQFGEFAQSFRDLSKEIPISVTELLAVGEAAGQLGIKKENILGFTETMAELGVTTNLSAEEAATALARLANITGLPQSEFERLGSTIVALGNNFATTEKEMVELALRLSGVGTSIGLTEGEIFALATTLSSVGINAEAGGSAFSRVMRDMSVAAETGGEAVETFANVSGVSMQEFSRIFKEDAAQALALFIEGLARLDNKSRIEFLDELGFSGIRVSDGLTRASNAGDLLSDTLDAQKIAWSENTALAKEAAQRYATFESRTTILWNRLKDLGITLGQLIIPMLDRLITAVTPMIEKFQNMSTEVQTAVLVVGALAAAVGPLLVIFGQLAIATGALGITFAGVMAAVSSLITIVLGPVGLVAAGVAILLSWKPVRDFLSDLATSVFTGLVSVVETAVDVLTSFWQASEQTRMFLGRLANVIVDDVVGSVTQLVAGIITTVEESVIWNVVIDTITGSINTLVTGVTDLVIWVGNSIKAIKDSIRDGGIWSVVWDTITGAIGDVINALIKFVPGLGAVVNKFGEWVDAASGSNGALQATVRFSEATATAGLSLAVMEAAFEKNFGSAEKLKTKLIELNEKLSDTEQRSFRVGEKVEILDNLFFDVDRSADEFKEMVKKLSDEMEDFEVDVEGLNDEMARMQDELTFAEKAAASLANFLETKLGRALNFITERASEFGSIIGNVFGEKAQRTFETFNSVVQDGFNSWAAFAKGDFIGGVASGVSALKGAFDALFPSTKLVEERIEDMLSLMESGEGTLKDFEKLTFDLTRSMEKAAEGWGEGGRALALMTDNFSRFVDVAREQGPEGLAAIQELVEAAKAAGIGLEVIADKLRETWDELADVIADRNAFIVTQTGDMVAGLVQLLGETGNVTRAEIEFAGTSIIQAFNSMLLAGVPVVDIVAQLGDVFDLVNERGQVLGLDLGEEFTNLGELFTLLADVKIQRIIERLDGMTAAAQAAANMGLLTTEQFDAWQSRLNATFNQLIEGGASSEVALAALQGPLQALFDASQQYGFSVRGNTANLLDMALAQGVVTDMGLTQEDILIRGFDKMIEAINALIVAMGGVPVALETWGASADDLQNRMGELGDDSVGTAERIRNAWRDATAAINENTEASNAAGGGNGGGEISSFQGGSGKFLNFGAGTPAVLHGTEQVINIGEGQSISAMVGVAIATAMQMGGGSMDDDRIANILMSILRESENHTRAIERDTDHKKGFAARMVLER